MGLINQESDTQFLQYRVVLDLIKNPGELLLRTDNDQFSMQEWVIIAEGEKDCDRLYELGFIATTCPMGAGKWCGEFNQYFKGRLVAIIPDNDSAGKKHAEQIANSLYGIASQVRIVELPGLPEKGDVSDWLNNGHDNGDLIRLIDQTVPFDPLKIDISKFKLSRCHQENCWKYLV